MKKVVVVQEAGSGELMRDCCSQVFGEIGLAKNSKILIRPRLVGNYASSTKGSVGARDVSKLQHRNLQSWLNRTVLSLVADAAPPSLIKKESAGWQSERRVVSDKRRWDSWPTAFYTALSLAHFSIIEDCDMSGIMSKNAATFQFVPMGQAGQPKNANDRKTIRKAAMLAYRRQERIERVKAFAAECAAQSEAKTVAVPTTLPDTNPAPTPKEENSTWGPMVLAKRPKLATGSHSWQQESRPDGDIPLITHISRDLGCFTSFSSGATLDAGYVFDYCTYKSTFLTPLSSTPRDR